MASISDRVGDLGDYLREQRENARLSVRQLASLAGVSNPYLSQVERGLRRPSAEVLGQIAKGLRISAEALYVRAGILDSEGRPDVEFALAADPHLTDRQRRVLLDIYTSFRAENAREAQEAEQSRPVADDEAPVVRLRVARKRAASPRTSTAAAADPSVEKAASAGAARKRSAATRSTSQRSTSARSTSTRAASKRSASTRLTPVTTEPTTSTVPTTSTEPTRSRGE